MCEKLKQEQLYELHMNRLRLDLGIVTSVEHSESIIIKINDIYDVEIYINTSVMLNEIYDCNRAIMCFWSKEKTHRCVKKIDNIRFSDINDAISDFKTEIKNGSITPDTIRKTVIKSVPIWTKNGDSYTYHDMIVI